MKLLESIGIDPFKNFEETNLGKQLQKEKNEKEMLVNKYYSNSGNSSQIYSNKQKVQSRISGRNLSESMAHADNHRDMSKSSLKSINESKILVFRMSKNTSRL